MMKVISSGMGLLMVLILHATVAHTQTTGSAECRSWITFAAARFSMAEPTATGLFLLDPDTGERRHILQDYEIGYRVAWSPDGTRLLFEAFDLTMGYATVPHLYDLTTGQVTRLSDTPAEWVTWRSSLGWSSSGAYVAYERDRAIHVHTADGQPYRVFSNTGGSWLPGDRLFINRLYEQATFFPQAIISMADFSETELDFWEMRLFEMGWREGVTTAEMSGDGSLALFITDFRGVEMPLLFDLSGPYEGAQPQSVAGGPVALMRAQLLDGAPGWAEDPALLAGMVDRYLYQEEFGGDYYVPFGDFITRDPETLSQISEALLWDSINGSVLGLTVRMAEIVGIAPSPDGRQYAVRYRSAYGDRYALLDTTILDDPTLYYEYPARSRLAHALRSFEQDEPPVWSPDGTRLAHSMFGQDIIIYGQQPPRSITADLVGYFPPVDAPGGLPPLLIPRGWSPDSERLVFVAFDFPDGPTWLEVIGADGSGVRRVYDGGAAGEPLPFVSAVSWSPCVPPQ